MTPQQRYNEIAWEIVKAREKSGLTLRQLDAVGISKRTYHSFVYGEHHVSLLKAIEIADKFGLELVVRKKGIE